MSVIQALEIKTASQILFSVMNLNLEKRFAFTNVSNSNNYLIGDFGKPICM